MQSKAAAARTTRPSRAVRRIAATAGLLAAALAAPQAGASAATPGPALSLAPWPSFALGHQISAASYQPYDETTQVRQHLRWTASDADGVCGYDVSRVTAGGWEEELRPLGPSASFTVVADDYDGAYGGGSFDTLELVVRAHDCAGASSTATALDAFTVTQEDGAGQYGPSEAGVLSTTGAWIARACTCASAGATTGTTAPGATATFRRTYERGQHVALVMPKGPGRGAVDVLVDGRLVRTVDTWAASERPRVVVFDAWMAAGTHAVQVVNRATPGRPRVDLDAVLTSG